MPRALVCCALLARLVLLICAPFSCPPYNCHFNSVLLNCTSHQSMLRNRCSGSQAAAPLMRRHQSLAWAALPVLPNWNASVQHIQNPSCPPVPSPSYLIAYIHQHRPPHTGRGVEALHPVLPVLAPQRSNWHPCPTRGLLYQRGCLITPGNACIAALPRGAAAAGPATQALARLRWFVRRGGAGQSAGHWGEAP